MQLANVQVEQKEPYVWELQVEVPADEVQRAMETVYRQLSRTLRVPGFRPGHIPPGLIKRWVGEERIHQQVLEDLLPEALSTVLQERHLEPVTVPEWKDIQFEEGQPLRFVAEVVTKPEVQLGTYNGLVLQRMKVAVTEEMVQQALEEVRQELAKFEPTEEAAQEGDRVRVRYRIVEEGKEPTEQWQTATLSAGASQWVPPLPEHLVGRKQGEEGEFLYTYDENHPNPQLAGKTVQVQFVVEGVLRRLLPELTDELVQQELGMASVEELKKELRLDLENRSRRTARALERAQAEEALLQQCQVTVPNKLVEQFTQQLLAETEASLRQRGWVLERWLAQQGKTLDQYRAELRQEAERRLKLRFILEAIAERENIAVTDEEVQQLLAQEEEVSEEMVASVRRQLLEQRVLDLVLRTAQWQEPDAETAQKDAE